MKNNNPVNSEILLYQTEDGKIKIETQMIDETVWLSQTQMANLFGVQRPAITKHLKNIFESGELDEKVVGSILEHTTQHGAIEGKTQNKQVKYYNLDTIIAVGYRVNSKRATQFRIWATNILKEFLIKGFAMDDERLKGNGGGNYFDELLARIRDIRSSEKVFWRKVLDIYASSIDYDPKSDVSKIFFAEIQNKMHWAAHGHTAAEIIYERVNSAENNLGLTNWTGDKIRKNEVSIAKNYLNKNELELLNRIVTAYLEFAELQALNRRPMYMSDWIKQLDMFLSMSGRDLLDHGGTISHQQALEKSQIEYEKFRHKQLDDPTGVEKHFIEAEKELNKIIRKRGTNE